MSCFNVKTNCFILKIKKIFWIINDYFCKKRNFGEKKISVKKRIVGLKEFSIKKLSVKKKFAVKNFGEKNFGEKIFQPKKIKFWSKKNSVKIFLLKNVLCQKKTV